MIRTLLFLSLMISYSSWASSLLNINSDTGDYIGQGKKFQISSTQAEFVYRGNSDGGISLSINNPPRELGLWWNFDIAPPSGETLKVGHYPNATRYPFQESTEAGLSFTGDGRGCNRSTGNFTVTKLSYNFDGSLRELDVDFVQHCEGGTSALRGSLKFAEGQSIVGTTVLGLNPISVMCINKTTGQSVRGATDTLSNDCSSLGLDVEKGHVVVIKLVGQAE